MREQLLLESLIGIGEQQVIVIEQKKYMVQCTHHYRFSMTWTVKACINESRNTFGAEIVS